MSKCMKYVMMRSVLKEAIVDMGKKNKREALANPEF